MKECNDCYVIPITMWIQMSMDNFDLNWGKRTKCVYFVSVCVCFTLSLKHVHMAMWWPMCCMYLRYSYWKQCAYLTFDTTPVSQSTTTHGVFVRVRALLAVNVYVCAEYIVRLCVLRISYGTMCVCVRPWTGMCNGGYCESHTFIAIAACVLRCVVRAFCYLHTDFYMCILYMFCSALLCSVHSVYTCIQ